MLVFVKRALKHFFDPLEIMEKVEITMEEKSDTAAAAAA